MLSLYKIKPKFQQLLKPLLVALYKMGVSANGITWAAIVLSCGTGIYFWYHPYGLIFIILPLVLLIRMALNALDGMMARTYNMQSKQGELLNELGDVVSDLFLFFPFLELTTGNNLIILVFLFLTVINEFAGVLGKVISNQRRYDGPMGKSDRAMAIGLLSLLLYFRPDWTTHLGTIFLCMSLLVTLSTGLRIYNSLKSKE